MSAPQNGNYGAAPNYFPNTTQSVTDSKDTLDATKVDLRCGHLL